MAHAVDRQRVLSAIHTLAETLALPSHIQVLSERGNLIARLGTSGVVARAQYLNGFMCREPEAWMLREIQMAESLRTVGAPVVAPSTDPRPGPYVVNGVTMSLWEDVVPCDELQDPCRVASMLEAFHVAASRVPAGSVPWLTPITQLIPDALEALDRAKCIDATTLHLLQREHDRLLDTFSAHEFQSTRLVHGDAHGGNLVRNRKDWIWIDLEDVSRGPIEWDLACLAGSRRLDGRAAVLSYRSRSGTTPGDLTPFLEARQLEEAAWFLGMACQLPDRYGPPANKCLRALLDRIAR